MILDTSTTARRRVRPRTAAFLGAALTTVLAAGPAAAATAAPPQVLTMKDGTVTGAAYNGTQSQSFILVGQKDGSIGIRAFYTS